MSEKRKEKAHDYSKKNYFRKIVEKVNFLTQEVKKYFKEKFLLSEKHVIQIEDISKEIEDVFNKYILLFYEIEEIGKGIMGELENLILELEKILEDLSIMKEDESKINFYKQVILEIKNFVSNLKIMLDILRKRCKIKEKKFNITNKNLKKALQRKSSFALFYFNTLEKNLSETAEFLENTFEKFNILRELVSNILKKLLNIMSSDAKSITYKINKFFEKLERKKSGDGL